MADRTIRAITFDLDDTLWDTKTVLSHAELQVFNWLKQHAPKVTNQFTIESLAKWRWDVYKNTPQLTHKISQARITAMQQVMVHVGYEEPLAAELASACFEVFIDARHNVTLFDEVMPMLEQLHDRYILGALTNGNANVSRLPIGELFEFSYNAEQFNASKPAPDLFIAAQQACHCSSAQIIHVGDHIEHDVAGARQAGCHALWFNPSAQSHPQQHLASIEVHSLSDIPQAITDFEQSLITTRR